MMTEVSIQDLETSCETTEIEIIAYQQRSVEFKPDYRKVFSRWKRIFIFGGFEANAMQRSH